MYANEQNWSTFILGQIYNNRSNNALIYNILQTEYKTKAHKRMLVQYEMWL